MKACNVCQEEKPLTEFYRSKATKDGHLHQCKPCMKVRRNPDNYREYQKNWQRNKLKDSEVRHDSNRHRVCRNKGITIEQYDEMLAKQNNRCGICKKHITELPKHRPHLFIDHNHETMTVRGLLCGPCNTGIGMLGDNKEGLKLALKYLEENDE